jgi:hypothetical protein
VIAYRAARRSVFLYGFAKSERENIAEREIGRSEKAGQALSELQR